MSKLKILVWEKREPVGEPDVEVTIPTYLSKWIPRIMKFMPKKTKEELWGEGIDFQDLNLDDMIREAVDSGESELMDVKTKEAHVKILIEK